MKYDPILVQAVLETEWFDLRPLRKSDQALIGLYSGDKRVAQMSAHIPHPLPPGAAQDYVRRALSNRRREHVWAMDATKAGGADLMGLIALEQHDAARAEIAFWIAPQFWNQGIAQRALQAIVTQNPLNVREIFGSVFQDNPAGAKVMMRAGFAYTGDDSCFCVARNTSVTRWCYRKTLAAV